MYPVGALPRGVRKTWPKSAKCTDRIVRSRLVILQDSQVMRRAMEYSKLFNLPVIDHCEDRDLSAGGVMNEGYYSTALGLRGINPAAEEVQVVRDLILAHYTGAHVHIAHISTKRSLEAVVRARRQKTSITCEATRTTCF